MKNRVIFLVVLVVFVAMSQPFTDYMKSKPFVEKLGYLPRHEVVSFAAADQKYAFANLLLMKALFYFGGLVEHTPAELILPADYDSIYRTVKTAVKIDPYNLDAYYFIQAAMSWHPERVLKANELLEYGMTKRDWDYQLPFYLGFNNAFFTKDYEKAAYYYQKAADMTGNELLARLAGRYMYESRRTDLALSYMGMMEQQATNDAIKKSFQVRIKAFQGVKQIELAITAYKKDFETDVPSLQILVDRGYLDEIPSDPYGGVFFIDEDGRVRSTSKFAYAGVEKDEGQQVK